MRKGAKHSDRRSRRPAASPARRAAMITLTRQLAGRWPAAAAPDVSELGAADRALAIAIHRTVWERRLTVEYLLDTVTRQPLDAMEPAAQAVLLAGGAQLLFMERLPTYAVINESVELAKALVRPGAGGLVNAVLRRVADMAGERKTDQPWSPAADAIPLASGSLWLNGPLLPDPSDGVAHLAAATSHPASLVEHWINRFGSGQATAMLLHDLMHPPLIVHVLDGEAPGGSDASSHEIEGHFVWESGYERLTEWLGEHVGTIVQDPTAGEPVKATRHLQPRLIADVCAGRGTKTRQLLVAHPQARVITSDASPERLNELAQQFGGHPRVDVVAPDALSRFHRQIDLLLLDVPCSNTGVLARRLEARYRFSDASIRELAQLQRQIITDAEPLLSDRGCLLYSTCSVEDEENEQQAAYAAECLKRSTRQQRRALPGGAGATYHDGGFFALLGPG